WFIINRDIDWAEFLNTALKGHTLTESIARLQPGHSDYRGLKDSLIPFANIADEGGWETITASSKLEKGDSGDTITLLYQRLLVTGDTEYREASLQDVFDDELEKAVKLFQHRHGLETDGVVGRDTLSALNKPVEERIKQIEANLERWRWLPHTFGSRYILVNIAGFELDVFENGASVLHMPVVVGREFTKTPVFSGTMTYLDINPYWNVPHTIAVNEILPKVKKDPSYLEKEEYQVLSGWTNSPDIVPPDSIDWAALNSGRFPYRIRQKPGEKNALGRIKFMFPNPYAIYLHDTPAKGLFQRAARSFSHGCIRVSGPVELAEYLLQNDPLWSRDKILRAIDSGVTRTINLPESIPVYLIYITAWVDKEGVLHFRDDIYNRDKPLIQALDSLPSIKNPR
ncbi:MAG: L,D-transpeptidase family protein, partial [Candidatus Aminicenantes bacterium]|nr:L,D-transpeptidase family protein [Candidatus Aminicenantes bacterium]